MIKSKKTDIIIMDNQLIEHYPKEAMSLLESKLLLYLISKINREKDVFTSVTLKVVEFSEMLGKDFERYSQVRSVLRKLREREVIIKKNDGGEIITGWISSINYVKGSGSLEIEFSKNLIPYLLQIGEYTAWEIGHMAALETQYSTRLYELLIRFQNSEYKTKKRVYKVDELIHKLGVQNKYKAFSDFRRYVLEPSIEDINNHTNIKILKYDLEKKGVSYTHICFEYQVIKTKEEEERSLMNLAHKKRIEEIKSNIEMNDFIFSTSQLIEIDNRAIEIGAKKGINEFKVFNMALDNLRIRKQREDLDSIISDFDYLMKIIG